MTDFAGEAFTTPGNLFGTPDAHGGEHLVVISGGSPPVVIYYNLRAHRTSDNSWQYWVDTAVQLTNAPGGAGNYDAATLTVQGRTK